MKPRIFYLAIGFLGLGILAALKLRDYTSNNSLEFEIPQFVPKSNLHPELEERFREAYFQIESESNLLDGLKALSRLYDANGYMSEASKCYEVLMSLDPTQPRWPHLLSRIKSSYGMLDDAINLHEKTLELDSTFKTARIQLANALLKQNRFDDAVIHFEMALTSDIHRPFAQFGLGRIYIHNRNWEAAIKVLESAVSESKGLIGIDLLATAYRETGDLSKADQLLRETSNATHTNLHDSWVEELLVDCYDPYTLSLESGFISRRGEFEKAKTLLLRAVSIAPEDPMVRVQFGKILSAATQIPEAIVQFETSIKIKPDNPEAWLYLIQAHRANDDTKAADEALMEGFRRCPDSPELLIEISKKAYAVQQVEIAIASLQKAIRFSPENANAYLNLARIHLDQNNTEMGIEIMRQALNVERGNPTALLTLAMYETTQGTREAADALFARIAKQPRISPNKIAEIEEIYKKRFGN